MIMWDLKQFIEESNRIEGIERDATDEEIAATVAFLDTKELAVSDLEKLVRVYQPYARLRDSYGLDVIVGGYVPPPGSPEIRQALNTLLVRVSNKDPLYDPWNTHITYEMLHPFTDGNGRSGRALWLWQMKSAPLGFLHKFYYQTLSRVGRKNG